MDYESLTASEAKTEKRKTIAVIIIGSIFYLFGIATFILGFVDDMFQMIIIGALLCGIFTGAASAKASEGRFWMKFFFFFVGAAFGLIASPIKLIADIVKISNLNEIIRSGY